MQRQSHSPNRASELPGKIWNIADSLGGIFGRWKEAKSSEPPAKFFPPKNICQWVGEDLSRTLCQNPASLKKKHSHWVQNWIGLLPLHPEAQSGPTATGDHPGIKESYHQYPLSSCAWTPKHHPICEGRAESNTARVETTFLYAAQDWKMQVDLDQKLIFSSRDCHN